MLTIRRLIEAKKAEREENGEEAGFSLIELIIVVVILGVLVAIAIPIFGNIQRSAQQSAVDTAAANGAAAVAAAIGDDDDATTVQDALDSVTNDDITVNPSGTFTTASTQVNEVCVVASLSAGNTSWPTDLTFTPTGPGC